MKCQHFKRRKTIRITLILIATTIIFGSVAAAVKTIFLIILFTVLTTISFVFLIAYSFAAVPDYEFSVELNEKHLIYRDSIDNGIVFDKETLQVTKKNRKFLVLEDKFNRFKVPYSQELEKFLMET